jgi:signal transduction histidine kinase
MIYKTLYRKLQIEQHELHLSILYFSALKWDGLLVDLLLLYIIVLSFLLAIVLSFFRFKTSVYPFGIFWPLYCLSLELRLLFTPLVSVGHCIVFL